MPLIYDGRGCTRRELATIASARMRNRESGIRGGSYPHEPVNSRERACYSAMSERHRARYSARKDHERFPLVDLKF